MKIITNNSEETIELGVKIGSLLTGGDVIFLSGDLGAGKTTFTKGIGIALDIKRVINSPTFTIVKEYNSKFNLYHIDLYRIEDLSDFGIEEYLNEESICVIEWPKQLEFIENYLEINITNINESQREFSLIAHGEYFKNKVGGLK